MNIPFRTGVNLREFAYYGTASVPYTRLDLQAAQLTELSGFGVQLIRLFGACQRLTVDQNIARLKATLDLIQRAGMQAIIALGDAYGSEWIIPGESHYHTATGSHLHKNYFLNRLYQKTYIPYIQRVAAALAGHPALLMWELGNEFAIHPQPAYATDERAIYNFAVEASAALKQITPLTLVSTGIINSNQVTVPATRAAAARRLYSLPTIDAVSIHFYAEDGEIDYATLDIQIGRELGKPFYVGEMGASITRTPDRTAYYANEFKRWRNAGAFTIMPWAFDTSPWNVGVSDLYAFARIHRDYNGLKAVVGSHATNAPAYRPTPSGTKRYQVVLGPLSVRTEPAISAKRLDLLANGTCIDVDPASRTEKGGYVWWRHFGKQQWSAEKRLIDNVDYMREIAVAVK